MYRVIKSLERAMSFLKINKGLQFEVEKAGLPPGTKRTWSGKDYIKGQDGKWNHAPKQGQDKEAPAGAEKPSGGIDDTHKKQYDSMKSKRTELESENKGMVEHFNKIQNIDTPAHNMQKKELYKKIQENAKTISRIKDDMDAIDYSAHSQQAGNRTSGIKPSVQIKDGKVTDNRRPDSIRTNGGGQSPDYKTISEKRTGALRERLKALDNWDDETLESTKVNYLRTKSEHENNLKREGISDAERSASRQKLEHVGEVLNKINEVQGKKKDPIGTALDKKGVYRKPAGTSQGQAQVDQAGRNKRSMGAPIEKEPKASPRPSELTQRQISKYESRKPYSDEDVGVMHKTGTTDDVEKFVNSLEEHNYEDVMGKKPVKGQEWNVSFDKSKDMPQHFILNKNGKKYLVNTEGYDNPRYVTELSGFGKSSASSSNPAPHYAVRDPSDPSRKNQEKRNK